jgi:nucleotide-binding universal stress UspA family protein
MSATSVPLKINSSKLRNSANADKSFTDVVETSILSRVGKPRCWDRKAQRCAARAVGDAIPFLRRARAVEVVIVGDRVKSNEIPGADIAHHLARHGVTVEVKEIIAADVDAANALLSHASDSSADFMVMGGYGHSRLREFVLGGVTRSILATMTIPTLLSH